MLDTLANHPHKFCGLLPLPEAVQHCLGRCDIKRRALGPFNNSASQNTRSKSYRCIQSDRSDYYCRLVPEAKFVRSPISICGYERFDDG